MEQEETSYLDIREGHNSPRWLRENDDCDVRECFCNSNECGPSKNIHLWQGKSSESVQCAMLKACDTCADMGQL